MKALVTGASSGIGKDIAIELSKRGYELILVSRNKKELTEVQKKLVTNSKIIILDLSIPENCIDLYNQAKDEDIDVLVNNAGFGVFGEFTATSLDKELSMINLNISAVHILTKLFLTDFVKKDSGYILNVSSSASFTPGPLMAGYYATKAYVLRLTESIYGELKKKKSNVYIGVLCPGPVDTNFNEVAGVQFSVKALTSERVANYAVNKMFKRRLTIVPGLTMKICHVLVKFIPIKLLIKITYNIQKKKEKSYEK